MKKNVCLVMLLGLMFLSGSGNLWAQNPYSDDPVVVVPGVPVVDTAQVNVPAVANSAANASETLAASITRSLWAELHKIYKESDKGRRGKRVGKVKSGSPTEHHLAGYDDLKISIDGDNYCGQFAMSTLLNGMGIKTDPQKIYQQTNPAGIFTSPPVIVETLRANGVNATMKNKASITDITKRLDQGKPIMVLVDSGDGTPHWICITGYDTDASGKVESFRMRDSYWGTSGPHTMSAADFEKAWKSPFGKGVLGDLMSYSNLLIDNNGTCEPGAPLYPGTFSTATEDNLAGGVNDVVTGWQNKSVAQVAGGVTKLLVGLPGAITGVASNFLNSKSQNWVSWGQNKMNEGGLGNKILGGAAVLGGEVTQGVAHAGKFVADAWSSGTSFVGNSIKKLGSLFS